jgi:hypothetical protein
VLSITTAVSLLLFLATVGLWARSYHVEDYFDELRYFSEEGTDYERSTELLVSHGTIVVTCVKDQITHTHIDWEEPAHAWRRHREWVPPQSFYDETIGRYPLDWSNAGNVQQAPQSLMDRMGFAWTHVQDPTINGIVIRFPLWAIATVTLSMPLVWLRHQLRRQNRRRRGRCDSCGYDLTGNESGVCPECGIARIIA